MVETRARADETRAKADERFPIDPYPSGWFFVGFSDDFPAGSVRCLDYFGERLVAFRGEGGNLVVADAFCPHLGAHLGYGGRVVGDDIVCPFHEWRWDPSGRNVEIPYANRPNKQARLRVWVVREIDGLVLVWHDEAGGEPTWEFPGVPELSSGEFAEPERTPFEVTAHLQDIFENAVDMAHFVSVHGAARTTPEVTLEESGARLLVRSTNQQLKAKSGYFEASVSSELWGLGIDIARITGIIDTVIVMLLTPIDERRVATHFAVTARTAGDGDDISPEKVTVLVRKAQDRLLSEFQADKYIWEHKRYLPNPNLASGEKYVTQYRRWAQQFYRDRG